MSFDALAWAAKQNPGTSGSKLVLLGLAECAHRKTGLAFPSLAELVEFSSLDRKSVISNLDKLEGAGFISDTGKRVGRTGQIKVYALNIERVAETEPSQKRNSSENDAKSTENGTRNLSEPLPSEAKASSGEARKRAQSKKPIPDDWQPGEFGKGTKSREVVDSWPAGELEAQLEQFKANHRGKGNIFLDPQDAWSTWVLNTRKFGIGKPAHAEQYVSKSGYVYRGDIDSVIRESERRADLDTYWRARGDKDRATGPPRSIGKLVKGIQANIERARA